MVSVQAQSPSQRGLVTPPHCGLIGVAILLSVNLVLIDVHPVRSREPGQAASSLNRDGLQNTEQLISQAETAELNEKYLEVEQIWRRIVQLQPKAIWAKYRLGSILSLQRKNEEAIALYRQIIQQTPNEASAYNNLGRELLTQSWGKSTAIIERQLKQALPIYRQAVELQPDLVETLLWPVNLSPEVIVSIVRQGLQSSSRKTAIDYLLLWSASRGSRQRIESARFGRQNFPALCQRYPESCRDWGKSNAKPEIEALQQGIQLDPRLAISYEMLGLSQSESLEYTQAATSFKQAIALNPQRAKPYYRLGEMLIAQNKLDEAMQVLRQAVQVEPNTASLDSMFWWYFNQQPRDKLIAALDDKVKQRPDAIDHYILGNLFYSLIFYTAQPRPADLEQAAIAFASAVELDPKFAKAYERLGLVLEAQKQLKLAEAAFRTAIQLNPRLQSAYPNLRRTLRAQGKFDAASQVFLAEQNATQ